MIYMAATRPSLRKSSPGPGDSRLLYERVRTTKEESVNRILEGLPSNVIGVEASGRVTDDDYENVLVPAVRATLDDEGKIRFIYILGDEFEGWTMGALWDDAKLGFSDLKAMGEDRCRQRQRLARAHGQGLRMDDPGRGPRLQARPTRGGQGLGNQLNGPSIGSGRIAKPRGGRKILRRRRGTIAHPS